MPASISGLRSAVVSQINAAGLGVTASPTWRGSRSIDDLLTTTVDVALTRTEAELETGDSTTLDRLISVVVRKKLADPNDDTEIDTVVQLAEQIGVLLLDTPASVSDTAPIALEHDPVIDDDAISDHGVAESIVTIRYRTLGA